MCFAMSSARAVEPVVALIGGYFERVRRSRRRNPQRSLCEVSAPSMSRVRMNEWRCVDGGTLR